MSILTGVTEIVELQRDYHFKAFHDGIEHQHCLTIALSGELDENGLLIEVGALDKIVLPIVSLVNNKQLETLPQRCSMQEAFWVAAQPTAERLAIWFEARLELLKSARAARNDGQIPGPAPLRLEWLRLQEDPRTRVVRRANRDDKLR